MFDDLSEGAECEEWLESVKELYPVESIPLLSRQSGEYADNLGFTLVTSRYLELAEKVGAGRPIFEDGAEG